MLVAAFLVPSILAVILPVPSFPPISPQGNPTVPSMNRTGHDILSTFHSMGGYFTENRGQVTEGVRYYSMGNPAVAFRDDGVMFVVTENAGDGVADGQRPRGSRGLPAVAALEPVSRSLAYMIRFEGANAVRPVGRERLPFDSNFFIGKEPGGWKTDVANFGEVVYRNLYDGTDLVYRVIAEGLKYEFIVSPGADPAVINVTYEGTESLRIDDGSLVAHTALEDVRDAAPVSFQEGKEVKCSMELRGANSYGFFCENLDASLQLVIDPLVYSTYLGGSIYESGMVALAVDDSGNAVVASGTDSPDFPVTPGVYQGSPRGFSDAYVSKLRADGSALIFSTFLGGSSGDEGISLALDSLGNVYLTGYTASSDFPVTPGAPDPTNGGDDVFVAKLNAAGDALIFSTFLGGAGFDEAWGIALDSQLNAYVTGNTESVDFPVTPGAIDSSCNGTDAFVTKLNAAGNAFLYSTFLGGNGDDEGHSVAVDASSNSYVTGFTQSADFPTTADAFDTSHNGGRDAFVVKIDPGGSTIAYSTFLGGSDSDRGSSIAVDSSGSAYVVGTTFSVGFPTTSGVLDSVLEGVNDGFVTKMNATGSGLAYSTFVGGSGADNGVSITLDSSGDAYVAGVTFSNDLPTTPGAFDATRNGFWDAYALHLNSTGVSVIYGTYIGGGGDDVGYSIALDRDGDIYVAGDTMSTNFPVSPGAIDSTYGGNTDDFIIKIDPYGRRPIARYLGVQGFTSLPGTRHVTDTSPLLNWTYYDEDGDPQARYEVKVGTFAGGGDMWSPGEQGGNVTSAMYGGPPLSRGTDYWFSVRVNDSIAWSNWTDIEFHTNSIPSPPLAALDPPQLSSVSSSVRRNVSWSASTDAEGDIVTYEWHVATDTTFSSFVASGSESRNTSSDFVAEGGRTFYWRVRARDDYEPLNWSAYGNTPPGYWTFSTLVNRPPAALGLGVQGYTSPPAITHITDMTPALNWTFYDPDGQTQVGYEAKVGTSQAGSDKLYTGAQTGTGSIVAYNGLPLASGTDYWFSVRVSDGFNWSSWAGVRFHVNSIPSPPPGYLSPIGGHSISPSASQRVEWRASTDAEGDNVTYEWQVATDNSFQIVVASGSGMNTSSAPFSTDSGRTYYWRVKARDDYEPSNWSEYGNAPTSYWSFHTTSPPTSGIESSFFCIVVIIAAFLILSVLVSYWIFKWRVRVAARIMREELEPILRPERHPEETKKPKK